MTFDELKGALILISYDAVSTDDANQAWHNVLPYAFENGNLLLNELDGEEDVDHTVVLEDYIKSLYAKIDVEIEDLFDNSAMRKVLRIVERSNRCWNRKYFFKKHI